MFILIIFQFLGLYEKEIGYSLIELGLVVNIFFWFGIGQKFFQGIFKFLGGDGLGMIFLKFVGF